MLISPGVINASAPTLVTPFSHFLGSVPAPDSGAVSTGALKSKVRYSSRDSIRLDLPGQKVYLFGDAKVDYEDMSVKAGYIEIDLGRHLVIAAGEKDSTGKIINKPELVNTDGTIHGDTIKYSILTKKGIIKFLTTEQSGGFVSTDIAKKDSNDVYYIKNGKYTTCDLEHPHYYLFMSKMKIIPDDSVSRGKIITGPAYLVLGDVPTPLAIPFGFFPNHSGRASGLIIPGYGESPGLGYYLKDGGYYFGISDHYDLALKGDIYSRGSWGAKALSNYNYRYKYNGNFALGYSIFKQSEKEFPDYSEKHDFNLKWRHIQDPKSNPSVRFSADVNILSSNYNKFNSNNTTDYLSNTFQSNVAWGKTWKYFNLSINLRHSQNTITHQVDLSLPQVALGMNRLYPFKSLHKGGTLRSKWYDKIGISYSSDFDNRLHMKDTNIFSPASRLGDSLMFGLRHSIPISASYSTRYFNFTPAMSFSSLWYFRTLQKHFDTSDALISDTVKQFSMANFYTLSLSTTTKLYGFYTFRRSRVKAIRHVITPSVAFNYRPDFGLPRYGYYAQTNVPGNSSVPVTYSIYEQGIYGSPPSGKIAGLTFGFDNNLEMKLRPSAKDTSTTDKKIVLIESFSISSGYNYAAEAFNLSPINFSGRTHLFKNFISITGNAVLDPYKMDSTGFRYNHFTWEDGQAGRITNANISLTASFRSKVRSDKTMSEEKSKMDKAYEQEYQYALTHPDYYVDFNVPWSLNISYNLRYSKPGITEEMTQSATFSGDLSLTRKWKIGFNSGWDFVKSDFTYTAINVYRDLHCWEMTFNWIPYGFRKSYTVTINVKSAVLQDLKLTRKRDWYDYN
jgi:hypothetical protein